MAVAYRFTDLGWLQFERLCMELMEICSGIDGDWKWHADGVRSRLVEGDVRHPRTGEPIRGPVCIVTSWWRPRTTNRGVHAQRVTQQAGEIWCDYDYRPSRVLALTNIDAYGLTKWGPGHAAQLVDAEGLGAIVDAEPELRRRLPSVLGVRDELDSLVSPDVLHRSTFDDGAAVELAPIFVPTPAYTHTLGVLERYRFAVLTGPPEMGKTAIARMVGLAQLTDGWEAHECIRPSELWERFDPDRAQVFIADDAFGSTEYQPESAERWARELDGILRAMDERHWLIWTSRPAPLRAGLRRVHRERGAERFPQPAEVQVSAAELDAANKALILYRHARAARLDTKTTALVRVYGDRIVAHPHFTPERIRRFVGGRLLELARDISRTDLAERSIGEAVKDEIQEPTTAMKASFEALAPEHRALLVALLDTAPGLVEEREIVAATRRHSESGFPRPPSELIDRLTDHFVRVVPPMSITWVHPSWRDLVIEQLRADDERRRRFLECCGIYGLSLALSVAGGAAGERSLPLLMTDRDWDALTDRTLELLPELDGVELYRLLSAVGEMALDVLDEHAARELGAFRRTLVDKVRDLWDECGEPIAVALLDAWFAVAEVLNPAPAPPALGTTWIEVLPVGPVDLSSPSDLARWEEWIALVRTVGRYREAELDAFGYPDRQLDAVMDLARQAHALALAETDPRDHEVVVRVLSQLLELRGLRWDWRMKAQLEAWTDTPRDLGDLPPSEPAGRPYYESEASLVDRILVDLEAAGGG